MAKVAVDLLGGSARRAQSHFGWNRHTVELGLCEQKSGIVCLDNFAARGNKVVVVAFTVTLFITIGALIGWFTIAPRYLNALFVKLLLGVVAAALFLFYRGPGAEPLPYTGE